MSSGYCDYFIKLIMVGSHRAGKTTMLDGFVDGTFTADTRNNFRIKIILNLMGASSNCKYGMIRTTDQVHLVNEISSEECMG
jgi:GTPase SAR1 family protein